MGMVAMSYGATAEEGSQSTPYAGSMDPLEEDVLQGVGRCLFVGQLVRPGDPLLRNESRTGVLIFRIVGGQVIGCAGPLQPPGRVDVGAKLAVQDHGPGIRPPSAPKHTQHLPPPQDPERNPGKELYVFYLLGLDKSRRRGQPTDSSQTVNLRLCWCRCLV